MNQLFMARNVLRQSSFEKFAQYLQKNKSRLTSIDYINLLQESFNLYEKEFIDYIRLFHKYFHDIVFCELDNGKRKVTVLQQILKNRRAWELEELLKIDQRIMKDFNCDAIIYSIDNACKNPRDQKNGYQLIQIMLQKRPDILQGPIYDDRYNPLIQSIRNQLYDIACLLLRYHCYILPTKNYSSNQLHYLFKNRASKRNHNKVLQVAKLLINNKVDIYQKNENGRPAFDFCHNQLKDEIQKMHKSTLVPSRTYPNKHHSNNGHSNSGGNRYANTQKQKNPKNQKYSNHTTHDNTKNYQTLSSSNQYNQHTKHDHIRSNSPPQNIISNHHHITSSTKQSSYKGKVKSEFGGKQIIKENNELVRINIQSNNLSAKDNIGHIGSETNLVKILNYDELENEAGQIFQKYTSRRQQAFRSQKQEHEKEEKIAKQRRTRIVQSQELKYYLKEDIYALTEKIKKQNIEKKPIYEDLLKNIKENLQAILPIQVGLFGSFATDLHLQQSDIDIVIIPKLHCQYSARYLFQKANQKLAQMKTIIQQTVFLDKASVPIIKATSTKEYDYKNIDISFQDQTHNGLKSVPLIKKYLQIYPQSNNLILVLKKFIYESKLFAPYSGGLSSYGLILMIVAFIQNEEKQNPTEKNKEYDLNLRVAELLIGFLKFYGFKMDYVTQKIIVARPEDINNEYYRKCTAYNPDWQNVNFLYNLVISTPAKTNHYGSVILRQQCRQADSQNSLNKNGI